MSGRAFVEYDGASVRTPAGRLILDGLALAVAEGETLALIRRRGSGKTPALRLMNARVVREAGAVRLAGRHPTEWDPLRLRRQTGYVIQDNGLLPHLTVAGNAGIVPELEGWEPRRRTARVEELLELVGLPSAEYAER